MKNKKSLSQALILSLTLHLVFALALTKGLRSPSIPQKYSKTTEVELIDAESLMEKLSHHSEQETFAKGQIVDQSERPINDEVPQNSRFLSRHNQNVVNETQAARHGQFNNAHDPGRAESPKSRVEMQAAADKRPESAQTNSTDFDRTSTPKPQADSEADSKIDSESELSPTELMVSENGTPKRGRKPSLRELTPSFKPGFPRASDNTVASNGGTGPAATDDHLKNVKTGAQTLLSTREFVYYSYYNRIKDKLRQTWEPKIKEKMERVMRQGRTIASTSDRVTRVVIVLDERGVLRKVQIISPSGIHDLDDAAVEAFRAAAPFPNPPDGIIDSDGTIKIRWDFILEANSSGLIDSMSGSTKVM